MVHPVLEEVLRARPPIRPDVLLRWQRAIRDEVIPALVAPVVKVKKESAA